LGVRCLNFPIDAAYEALLGVLDGGFETPLEFGMVNENLQARLRGVILMAISNRESSLLLTTGNKSEYATGYCTLYGDMCGGLAPIADLLKTRVYELGELSNTEDEILPGAVIERPPAAELGPIQKDQDSLPSFE